MKKFFIFASICLSLAALLVWFWHLPAPLKAETEEKYEHWRQFEKLQENLFFRHWLEENLDTLQGSPLWSRFGPSSAAQLARSGGEDSDAAVVEPFLLTFPHNANGTGAGLRFISTTFVLNNSDTDAHGTIFYYRNDGARLSVTTNLGTSDRFEFTLLPGESLRVETDGSGPITTGWVEVVSDIELSGSGSFTVFNAAGQFLSEVGIGDSPRSRSLMLLVDTQDGQDTSYAVCNPSASTTAQVKLEIRRLDGSLISSKEATLPPRNQKAEFVREAFPANNLNNFQGVLVLTSQNTDVSLVTIRSRGVQFTSLPAAPLVGDTSRGSSLLFARMADGVVGGLRFQSSFIFLNHSDKVANVSLDLIGSDGTPMQVRIGASRASRFSFQVPARGAIELRSDGSTPAAAVGWARATSDIPVAGSGTFSLRDKDTAQFVTEVGVPNSPTSSRLEIFAQVQGQIDTGLGLTNPNAVAQTVKLRLLGHRTGAGALEAGPSPAAAPTVVAETEIQIPAGGHIGQFVSEFFRTVPEVQQRSFEGRLLAEGTGLTGVTLRTRGAFLTSLPAANFKLSAFAPKLTVTTATSLEGATPALYVILSQLKGETVGKSIRLTFDKGRVNFSGVPQNAIIGNSIQTFLGFLFVGRLFAFNVTADSLDFFTTISFDSSHETVPFVGKIRNSPGDGFTIEVEANPGQYSNLEIDTLSTLCFEGGLIRLPPGGSRTVQVQERYESFEQHSGTNDALTRTSSTSFSTSTLAAANPRIESAVPGRVWSGAELLMRGANFSASPAGNKVTVEGNSRVEATVLEASPSQLRVRLPDNLARGPLQVAVGSLLSNSYQLDVVFAPQTQLSFGSLARNAETSLKLTLNQTSGQIAFDRITLKPSAGSWKTAGFAAGALVGTMRLLQATLELKVQSSGADKLVLHAFEAGSGSASYILEISNSGPPSLILRPPAMQDTVQLTSALGMELNLTSAVFRMPSAAGSVFDVSVEVLSMPERMGVEPTAIAVRRKQTFTTN